MGRYTNEISRLKAKFDATYSPENAFGNPELILIKEQLARAEQKMEGKQECGYCRGWGTVECNECGHDRECGECEDGLIEI